MSTHDEAQTRKVSGGPLSYDAIRSIKLEVVDAIVQLNSQGLAWNAIAVMRDVCRVTYRFAGGPDGGANRRHGMSAYRYGISPVINSQRLQLEFALCMSLYSTYDPCLAQKGRERDLLVDPPALWLAWCVFRRMNPSSSLKIQQVWIGARALLQGSFELLTCPTCDTVHLEGSHTAESDECHISGCYLCDRKAHHRNLMTARSQRTERRRERARVSSPGRGRSHPAPMMFSERVLG